MDKLPPVYVSPISKRSSRGQSLVEFAITLPILLLIMVGILDLGRVYFAYISLTNAAREGARYGAAHPTQVGDCSTPNTIKYHACQEVDGNIVKPIDLTINVTCNPCTPGPSDTPGINNPIVVNVTYSFPLITTYIFGGGTILLQTSAQMVIYAQ
jgi:Flp pilus assembly protein TadG